MPSPTSCPFLFLPSPVSSCHPRCGMPGQKVLCVAEKPAIAKAVAQHLAGGQLAIHPIRGNQYVKNYEFQYNFPQWGSCQVVMTSVLGHLTTADFEQAYKSWKSCQPLQLFDAPLATAVDRVRMCRLKSDGTNDADVLARTKRRLPLILRLRPNTPRSYSSGPIVIVKENTLVLRS